MQTLVISVLLAALVGGGVGYRLGHGMAAGDCAARELAVARAYAANQDTAVEAARRDAEAESDRRTAQALRDARRASAAREIRLKGQIHAIHSARPECAAPAERVRLYNDAVDAANGADVAP